MPTLPSFGLVDRFMQGPAHRAMPVQPALPLQGVTVLAVEDSRFSSDALRLLCQRSGARLRRVETLATAQAHLRVYRPDVVLIDMGLPDGRGDSLIRDLTKVHPLGAVVIAISGDPDAGADAFAAGAHSFLKKPFPGLSGFQAEILRFLPDRADRAFATSLADPITPDPLSLQDDLERASQLGNSNPTERQCRYLAGFVAGIAASTGDPALAAAAHDLTDAKGVDRMCQLLATRINARSNPFGGPLT